MNHLNYYSSFDELQGCCTIECIVHGYAEKSNNKNILRKKNKRFRTYFGQVGGIRAAKDVMKQPSKWTLIMFHNKSFGSFQLFSATIIFFYPSSPISISVDTTPITRLTLHCYVWRHRRQSHSDPEAMDCLWYTRYQTNGKYLRVYTYVGMCKAVTWQRCRVGFKIRVT